MYTYPSVDDSQQNVIIFIHVLYGDVTLPEGNLQCHQTWLATTSTRNRERFLSSELNLQVFLGFHVFCFSPKYPAFKKSLCLCCRFGPMIFPMFFPMFFFFPCFFPCFFAWKPRHIGAQFRHIFPFRRGSSTWLAWAPSFGTADGWDELIASKRKRGGSSLQQNRRCFEMFLDLFLAGRRYQIMLINVWICWTPV